MSPSPPPPVVAVLAFDGISPFHLAVPCEIFGDLHPGAPVFDLRVCAGEPGSLRTSAGFSFVPEQGLETLEKASLIIVPSWRDPAERSPTAVLEALIAAHRRGATVVGLCLGAYVLAETGLLDGLSATTHWSYAEDFAARFPRIKVDMDVLYIDEGSLVTSAGTAAGIDCCLHLLRRQYGAASANCVARRLVVSPHRQGGQAQFVEHPLPVTARDSRLGDLLPKIRARLEAPHTVDSLAAEASMSRRSFTRHFKALTGISLQQWLQNERLICAQQLLEQTNHSIDAIATLAGFGSAVNLRFHFRSALGISPSVWRRDFARF